jgi:hypothetical protein
LTQSKKWKESSGTEKHLFPVKAMSKAFSKKMIAAFSKEKLLIN